MENLLEFFKSQNQLFFDALGERHTIDGQSIVIAVDRDGLKRREDKSGVNLGDLMYYAQLSDFARLPQPGEVQVYDGRAMTVVEAFEDCGLLRVVLLQNRG